MYHVPFKKIVCLRPCVCSILSDDTEYLNINFLFNTSVKVNSIHGFNNHRLQSSGTELCGLVLLLLTRWSVPGPNLVGCHFVGYIGSALASDMSSELAAVKLSHFAHDGELEERSAVPDSVNNRSANCLEHNAQSIVMSIVRLPCRGCRTAGIRRQSVHGPARAGLLR